MKDIKNPKVFPASTLLPEWAKPEDEIIELRSINAKHFRRADGRVEMIVSRFPVHYRDNIKDEKEDWKEIELNPTKIGGSFKNDKSFYKVDIFTDRIGYSYTSKRGGRVDVELVETGGQPVNFSNFFSRKDSNRVLWYNATEGLDIQIILLPHKVSVFKRLRDKNSPRSLKWKVTEMVNGNCRLRRETEGFDDKQSPLEIINSTKDIEQKNIDGNEFRIFEFYEEWTGRVAKVGNKFTRQRQWSTEPKYPLLIDADITEFIQADSDDAYGGFEEKNLVQTSSWWGSIGGGTGIWFGISQWKVGADTFYLNSNLGLRFQTVNIGNSASMDSATLKIRKIAGYSAGGTFKIKVYGNDVDNAATWATGNRPHLATKTTAKTTITPVLSGFPVVSSVNVKSIVSEIIGRAGWAANNNMAFVLDPVIMKARPIASGASGWMKVNDYGASSDYVAHLVIVYNPGGGSATEEFTVDGVIVEGGRIWSTGFELQSATAGMEATSFSSAPTIDTTIKRSGEASLNCLTGNPRYMLHDLGVAWKEIYARVCYYFDAFNYSNYDRQAILWLTTAGGAGALILTLNHDGAVNIENGDTGAILATTEKLVNNRWYEFELHYKYVDGTNDVWALKLEGQTLASGTTAFGARDSIRYISAGMISGSGVFYGQALHVDDIAVNYDDWPGDGHIVHMQPNAAGDFNNAVSGDYTSVDEITPNDATDIAVLDDNNDILDVNLESSSNAGIPSTASIRLVSVGTRLAGAAAGTPTHQTRVKSQASGTVKDSGTLSTTNTAYKTNAPVGSGTYGDIILYYLTSYLDPQAGGVWTTSLLDSAQIGVKAINATPDINLSTLWLLVEYYEPYLKTFTVDGVIAYPYKKKGMFIAGSSANTSGGSQQSINVGGYGGNGWLNGWVGRSLVVTSKIRLKRARVWLSAAPTGGTFKFYIKGQDKDGNQTVGLYETNFTADTDRQWDLTGLKVPVGTLLTIAYFKSGTPTDVIAKWAIEYESDASRLLLGDGSFTFIGNDATRRYFPIIGGGTPQTTLGFRVDSIMPIAGTVREFAISLSGSPGGGKSWTFSIYKNGSEEASSQLTIADTNNYGIITGLNIAFSAGDKLACSVVATNTPANAWFNLGVSIEPTNSTENILANAGSSFTGSSPDRYAPVLASDWSQSTTESDWKRYIGPTLDILVKNLRVEVESAPGAGTSIIYTLRKGAQDTALTVTIADTATSGNDTSHSISISAGDYIDMKFSASGSPGAPRSLYSMLYLLANPSLSLFAVDGFVADRLTKTFTVDGMISALAPFTADGYVADRLSKTFTVDGYIADRTVGPMFTADGFVAERTPKTFTADGYVALITTKTFTADGYVAERTTGPTFTIDGFIGPIYYFLGDSIFPRPNILERENIYVKKDVLSISGKTGRDVISQKERITVGWNKLQKRYLVALLAEIARDEPLSFRVEDGNLQIPNTTVLASLKTVEYETLGGDYLATAKVELIEVS